MYLKTFDDMKKTSAFFMLKPVNAVYGFIVTVCLAIVAVIIWACLAPMDEVMNVSDRIAVIYEGKIVGIVDAKDADENTLGLMMAGGEDNE